MLNPSTADEFHDDPTLKRCGERAKIMGFGGFTILNAFAFRATNPDDMKAQLDPVGPENNQFISEALRDIQGGSGSIYLGWGNHGSHLGRDEELRKMIKSFDVKAMCLKKTNSDQPVHPLYQSYKTKFQEFV
jgi:hypothetical protein